MPWQEIILVNSLRPSLAAVAEPTNPSSFVLAVVGIGTFLCYRLWARPGHARGRPVDLVGSPVAKPPATVIVAEDASGDRRVA